jgi:glycosyltransferase involved in cell wall biosynthesis
VEPTITAVIPAYNAAEHLERALWGALSQTRLPDEILVIDDGSTDATAELARSYGPPVRVIAHEQNRGLSAARNTGIRQATGEWIALLDADDLWYPPKLERQMEALHRAGDAPSVVFCLTLIRQSDGQYWIDCRDEPLPQEEPEAFIRALLEKNAVSGSGCSPLIRRDLLLRVGGYDEGLRTCEDWDLWLRLARRGRFCRVDEVLCEGYARADGLSLKLPWLLADAAEILDRHLPGFLPDPREAAEVRQRALDRIVEYTGGLERGAA